MHGISFADAAALSRIRASYRAHYVRESSFPLRYVNVRIARAPRIRPFPKRIVAPLDRPRATDILRPAHASTAMRSNHEETENSQCY